MNLAAPPAPALQLRLPRKCHSLGRGSLNSKGLVLVDNAVVSMFLIVLGCA